VDRLIGNYETQSLHEAGLVKINSSRLRQKWVRM